MANELRHYGTPRRSGRYPWGSGEDPEQRGTSWLGRVHELRKQGLSYNDIAKGEGMTTNQLRKKIGIEGDTEWAMKSDLALRLKDKGMSNVKIGERMGVNESVVRSYLDPALRERRKITATIAGVLQDSVAKDKYIDIGSGAEQYLGVSRVKLDNSIFALEQQGYKILYLKIPQQGTDHSTSMKVLVAPFPESEKKAVYAELAKDPSQIKMIYDKYSEDGGRSVLGLEPVQSIDSKRIFVRYGGEGGELKDGVIELRQGVPDISLGEARYAQVRVGVDGNKFMKGMALYSDNIPDGYDVVYNSSKTRTDANKVFKSMETVDPKDSSSAINQDNPFGAAVRQRHYLDADGVSRLSALNKIGSSDESINEEGKWGEWKKTISSQILSKQTPQLAKKQLGLAYDVRKEEFDEINSLTNPAVKKVLLQAFSDKCDSSSKDLEAAALPRQASQVLLPITSMSEKEVYAPQFRQGESVVLIRHPHGGIFEIPELVVNNNNPEGKRILGDAKDAVGINPKVAQKLSGADFDGDAVIVIPNKDRAIMTKPSIKSLMTFDPRGTYKLPDDAPEMTDRVKQLEMGKVSNLITDMTIRGAGPDEIARAVRHSMVVIDAVKHHLDYKRSAIDENIADLKKKYQGKATAGASTIISKADSQTRVPLRKEQYSIDPKTGKKVYKYITGETYINAQGHKVKVTTSDINIAKASPGETYISRSYKDENGKNVKVTKNNYDIAIASPGGIKEKVVRRTTPSKKMLEVDDARTLSSGTPIEKVYAEHANKLKALANAARKTMIETPDIHYSQSAAKTYKKEVESLDAQLNLAYRNKPLERKAQLMAGKVVSAQRQSNPQMSPGDLKKIRGQALIEQRTRTGAGKNPVVISDKEWEAIQAGAISNSKLKSILLNTKLDDLKQRSMPRTFKVMSPAKIARAKSMRDSGHTDSDIADLLGVSTSSLQRALK